jgi:hypothetical protein
MSGDGQSTAASITYLVSPSAAQLKARLLTEITPSGKAAKILALLKRHGYVLAFTAPSVGKVLIAWYYQFGSAHVGTAKRTHQPKPVLVAIGSAQFLQTGTVKKIRIGLTRSGVQLLNHARRIRLTVKGTFMPAGQAPIVATKTFTLKR